MTSSSRTESVRLGNLWADPQLSKFQPLERILLYDHFDCGLSGWTEVLGDYEDRLENVTQYPELMDSRPPMLSTATMHDSGSAGAFSGTYSMKVATRPKESHVAKALRRLTFRRKSRLQCELYFTFKPEASEIKLSELDLRAFGVSYGLQDDRRREWPSVRFLNAEGKNRIERWQYHAGGTRAPHLDGWEEVPKGHQQLCYNETATKQNWHYLRWLIDLSRSRYLELQCNDRSWDLSGSGIPSVPKNPNLRTLMNLGSLWRQTQTSAAFSISIQCFSRLGNECAPPMLHGRCRARGTPKGRVLYRTLRSGLGPGGPDFHKSARGFKRWSQDSRSRPDIARRD